MLKILGIFFCAVSVAIADQEIESLRGLPALVVDVKIMAPIPAGIGETDLKAAIESRLNLRSIQIADGIDRIAAPRLFISVTAPVKTGMFLISADLSQYVKPFRPDQVKATCTESSAPALLVQTWHTEMMNMVINGNASIPTREAVEELVDRFAKNLQTANQK